MAYERKWLYVPNIDERTIERLGQIHDAKKITVPYKPKA